MSEGDDPAAKARAMAARFLQRIATESGPAYGGGGGYTPAPITYANESKYTAGMHTQELRLSVEVKKAEDNSLRRMKHKG
jgi:hypothetical protein